MRRARVLSMFAVSIAACAAIIACSLQDGGILDLTNDAASGDATTDTSAPFDSSPPNQDAMIVDAGATFCDLTTHDAAFFFCADFDDTAATHGFTEVVTDGGSVAFVASDASAPNLFQSTLANPNNDNSQNAYLTEPFDFPDGGDAGISFLSIAFDLRVNSILLDGAAPFSFSNTFIVLLSPGYAIYAPIVGRPSLAPAFDFGTVDFSDSGATLASIGDGGAPVGEWNHFRFIVEVGADGGPSTLSVYEDTKLISSQVVNLAPAVFTSRQLVLLLGPSANGPVNGQLDFDNVVIRSDKL